VPDGFTGVFSPPASIVPPADQDRLGRPGAALNTGKRGGDYARRLPKPESTVPVGVEREDNRRKSRSVRGVALAGPDDRVVGLHREARREARDAGVGQRGRTRLPERRIPGAVRRVPDQPGAGPLVHEARISPRGLTNAEADGLPSGRPMKKWRRFVEGGRVPAAAAVQGPQAQRGAEHQDAGLRPLNCACSVTFLPSPRVPRAGTGRNKPSPVTGCGHRNVKLQNVTPTRNPWLEMPADSLRGSGTWSSRDIDKARQCSSDPAVRRGPGPRTSAALLSPRRADHAGKEGRAPRHGARSHLS